MKKVIVFVVVIVVCLIGVATLLFSKPEENKTGLTSSQLDSFAQCLTKKKVVMYGAEWCPHCQKQKAMFGSSFKYVSYVECPDNPKVCLDKGVKGYPTWIFTNGNRLTGEQGVEALSKESGCALPKK